MPLSDRRRKPTNGPFQEVRKSILQTVVAGFVGDTSLGLFGLESVSERSSWSKEERRSDGECGMEQLGGRWAEHFKYTS